jgi:thiol-disulfide isomerase/thioredoxin
MIRQNNKLVPLICVTVLIAVVAIIALLVTNSSGTNAKNITEEFNDSAKPTIVLYYASWCGYSKMFLPEWEKFKKYAQENLPNILVRSVRCEGGDEATCMQKGVQGYPTVILYKEIGKTGIPFDNDRTAEKLIEFVNNHQ